MIKKWLARKYHEGPQAQVKWIKNQLVGNRYKDNSEKKGYAIGVSPYILEEGDWEGWGVYLCWGWGI
jgi:hypothetical protein